METVGKSNESINPTSSYGAECISDSLAIALVNPIEGNPSIRYPPSRSIGLISLIQSLGNTVNVLN